MIESQINISMPIELGLKTCFKAKYIREFCKACNSSDLAFFIHKKSVHKSYQKYIQCIYNDKKNKYISHYHK